METTKKIISLTLMLLLATVAAAFPQPQGEESPSALVGRIAHVEGQLLRYVAEDQDWVAAVKDAPFGLDDALYADDGSRAEFIMPNGTWVRVGDSTQIQLINCNEDVTEIDVASGVARFFNKSSDAVIKVSTPFGYVLAPAGSSFDLYGGDESVEVIGLRGNVDFVHAAGDVRYGVAAGESSLLADSQQVTAGEGTVDADWEAWNSERDNLWDKRLQVRGDSVKYLPPALNDDAYTLEENGRWEKVDYEGAPRYMWRPTRVEADWAPFTVGRWTDWYGDQCWVPAEPYGYITHHYGNWVYVGQAWYWAPPMARTRVAAFPGVDVGFGWYPGRVVWIHSGVDVGWVPLAPYETYYSHRHWGPRSVVITGATAGIAIGSLGYLNHAVIVNQNNFYNVNDYHRVRITDINHTTIISNYRAAPVINNTVINNYNSNKQRYNFTNVNVNRKPHQSVMKRIEQNQALARKQERVRGQALLQDVDRMQQAKPAQEGRVKPPKVANRIVGAEEVMKPQSEVKFQERQVKSKAAVKPHQLGGGKQQPATGEEPRMKPTRPEQAERMRPGKPEAPVQAGREERPGVQQESEPAERAGHKVKPARPEGGERIKPGRPEGSVPSGREEPKMRPGRPEQPEPMPPDKQQAPGQAGREQLKVKPPRPDGEQRGKPEKREAPFQSGREEPKVKHLRPEQPQPGPHGPEGTQENADQKKHPKSPRELEQQ